jgi:hypothetical protein
MAGIQSDTIVDSHGESFPLHSVSEFQLRFNADENRWFYASILTAECFWALEGDYKNWMVGTDEDTQRQFYRNATTGETRYDEPEEDRPLATVWEEYRDPISGRHYYYSNV